MLLLSNLPLTSGSSGSAGRLSNFLWLEQKKLNKFTITGLKVVTTQLGKAASCSEVGTIGLKKKNHLGNLENFSQFFGKQQQDVISKQNIYLDQHF